MHDPAGSSRNPLNPPPPLHGYGPVRSKTTESPYKSQLRLHERHMSAYSAANIPKIPLEGVRGGSNCWFTLFDRGHLDFYQVLQHRATSEGSIQPEALKNYCF